MKASDEQLDRLRLSQDPIIAGLANEVYEFRSALAADRERVRSVVRESIEDLMGGPPTTINNIATRAAEQLATAGVGLSDVDRVRLRSVRELLDRQPDVWDLEANLIDRIIGAK